MKLKEYHWTLKDYIPSWKSFWFWFFSWSEKYHTAAYNNLLVHSSWFFKFNVSDQKQVRSCSFVQKHQWLFPKCFFVPLSNNCLNFKGNNLKVVRYWVFGCSFAINLSEMLTDPGKNIDSALQKQLRQFNLPPSVNQP